MRIYHLLFLIFLCFSCTSGKKQLEKGNYDTSVKLSVQRLEKSNGNHNKSRETLKSAFPHAIQKYKGEISKLMSSTNIYHWEKIALNYKKLLYLNQLVNNCSSCKNIVKTDPSYQNSYTEACRNASKIRYQAGEKALAYQDREHYKEAYWHYKKAHSFNKNMLDVQEKISFAKDKATINILVNRITIHSSAFDVSIQKQQNNLSEFYKNYKDNHFVQFYDRTNFTDTNKRIDHLLNITVDYFDIGNTLSNHQKQDVKKDNVLVGRVEKDSIMQDVFGTVNATFFYHKKQASITGNYSVDILDVAQDKIIGKEIFPCNYLWSSEWGTFKGDKRALSSQQTEQCNMKEEQRPTEQALFNTFSTKGINKSLDFITNFYKLY